MSKSSGSQLVFHSFIQSISISPLQVHYHSEALPNIVPEVHAEEPQATVSEGLAQGPYTWRV